MSKIRSFGVSDDFLPGMVCSPSLAPSVGIPIYYENEGHIPENQR